MKVKMINTCHYNLQVKEKLMRSLHTLSLVARLDITVNYWFEAFLHQFIAFTFTLMPFLYWNNFQKYIGQLHCLVLLLCNTDVQMIFHLFFCLFHSHKTNLRWHCTFVYTCSADLQYQYFASVSSLSTPLPFACTDPRLNCAFAYLTSLLCDTNALPLLRLFGLSWHNYTSR